MPRLKRGNERGGGRERERGVRGKKEKKKAERINIKMLCV